MSLLSTAGSKTVQFSNQLSQDALDRPSGEHGEDEGCKVGFSAFTGSTGSAWFSLIWSWCWVTR